MVDKQNIYTEEVVEKYENIDQSTTKKWKQKVNTHVWEGGRHCSICANFLLKTKVIITQERP